METEVTISDSGGRGVTIEAAAARKVAVTELRELRSQSERTKAVRGEWLVMERLLFTAS